MSKPRARPADRTRSPVKPGAPIWARPAPGTRRPRLTREQIAEVALGIADREGFEAVSMRRIAEELGAGTMTLYHYMRTKDELLALMDDALMAQSLVPVTAMPAGWRAGLALISRRMRDVFVKHPWALHALRGAQVGPNNIRHIEQTLAAASSAPLEMADRLALCSVLDDFVFGFSLRTLEATTIEAPLEGRAIDAMVNAQLATGELPHLAAFVGTEAPSRAFERAAKWMNDEGRFEFALQAILDAVEGPRKPTTPGQPPEPKAPARQARTKTPRKR